MSGVGRMSRFQSGATALSLSVGGRPGWEPFVLRSPGISSNLTSRCVPYLVSMAVPHQRGQHGRRPAAGHARKVEMQDARGFGRGIIDRTRRALFGAGREDMEGRLLREL